MKVKTRFAPSPTGLLHVGNIRVALINWLFTRKHEGEFVLRLDDTDTSRSRQEYANAIYEDMQWLGLSYNSTFRQQDRLDIYNKVRDKLIEEGRLYACYETPQELEYNKKLQLSLGKPPIYDRKCLNLSKEEEAEFIKEGRKPYYRFKLMHEETAWKDLIHGDIKFHGSNLSDPVFIRDDGSYLYQFTSVIDDIDTNITHVIRGEDHIPNTAIQIQLFKALNSNSVEFGHFPLLSTVSGAELSKRTGSLSISSMRQDGIEAMAINNVLFMIGLGERNHLYKSLEEMVVDFNISVYNKSSAKFDEAKIPRLTAQLIHNMDFATAKARIKDEAMEESFWNAIKDNLATIKDYEVYKNMVYGDITPLVLDKGVIKVALENLPTGAWDDTTWSKWTGVVKGITGKNGVELYKPIRGALIGAENGPEMKQLIQLIGIDKIKARLQKALA